MGTKLNNESFIKKAKEKHNNKYDYSLVEYINALTKIKIICPIHGVFEQLPYHHLNGHGCKKCSDQQNGKNKTFTLEQFIQKSNDIHNNKYDYSLVEYINALTKIKIICPIHGIFEQTPSSHTNQKQGCPFCANNIKYTNDIFIKKSKEKHGNKYDYSLVDYKNNRTKVKIICPIHGEFKQISGDHIRGIGCSKCQESKNEIKIKEFLDRNNIEYETQKKFDKCKYIRNLKFDFYLPKYNICIEYDGEQHTVMYRFEKDDKKLQIRIIRDKIKTEFCRNNNIKLIRISHKDNIEKILNTNLLF